MVDESTKKILSCIPILKTNAGPRDLNVWNQRLKEEYLSLIKVRINICMCFEDTIW
jgi:ufm1-conjugating enzyme 1